MNFSLNQKAALLTGTLLLFSQLSYSNDVEKYLEETEKTAQSHSPEEITLTDEELIKHYMGANAPEKHPIASVKKEKFSSKNSHHMLSEFKELIRIVNGRNHHFYNLYIPELNFHLPEGLESENDQWNAIKGLRVNERELKATNLHKSNPHGLTEQTQNNVDLLDFSSEGARYMYRPYSKTLSGEKVLRDVAKMQRPLGSIYQNVYESYGYLHLDLIVAIQTEEHPLEKRNDESGDNFSRVKNEGPTSWSQSFGVEQQLYPAPKEPKVEYALMSFMIRTPKASALYPNVYNWTDINESGPRRNVRITGRKITPSKAQEIVSYARKSLEEGKTDSYKASQLVRERLSTTYDFAHTGQWFANEGAYRTTTNPLWYDNENAWRSKKQADWFDIRGPKGPRVYSW